VLTQFTGPPEFETAEEPSGPHGMPTAGRVSKPPGSFVDVVDVVDVGGVEFGTVVCGTVVCGTVVWDGGVVVVLGTGLVVVGNVVTGALTTGRGPITGGCGGGAMSAGGAVDNAGIAAVGSAEVVSTLVGVSLD
jgi:hypothetical protein